MRRTLLALACGLALMAGQVQAQGLADYDYTHLSFRGIGVDLGYIWPTKVHATPMYSARVDLGFLGPGVRIAPSVSYWSSSMRDGELRRFAESLNRLPTLQNQNVTLTAADLGDVDWSDLSLSIDGQYVWTTPLPIETYLGAGLGMHVLNGRGQFINGTFIEDLLDSFGAGAAVMGGIEYEPSPRLRLYGEARYNFVGEVHYKGIRLGGALMLPPRGTAAAQRAR